MSKVGIIESEKMTSGVNLMKGNSNLVQVDTDFSNLQNGNGMFNGCSNLSSFKSNLCSLTDGTDMFTGCKLDEDSIHTIALSINNKNTDNPKLNLGVNVFVTTNDQANRDFDLISHKGWDLTVWCAKDGEEYTTFGTPKYAGCKKVADIRNVDADYLTNDIINSKFIDGGWRQHLPNLTTGTATFHACTTIKSFDADLSSLISGQTMFMSCSNLTSFNSHLCVMKRAESMFKDCTSLKKFNVELPKLNEAVGMFEGCTSLTNFDVELPMLMNGGNMFCKCSGLTSFSSDLSSLTFSSSMFSGCTSLTSFDVDLSSVVDGSSMFMLCTNLTSYKSNLSNLKCGWSMFYGCNLNAESLSYIANNINNLAEKGYDRTNDEHWRYDVNGETYNIYGDLRGSIDLGNTEGVDEEIVKYCCALLNSKGWNVYFDGELYQELNN